MADRAGSYNVIQDFGDDVDPLHLDHDAYWVVAVVRLGLPLSFSRATMSSVTKDLTQGALLRAEAPLVITDDCVRMNVTGSKNSHTKSMALTLKQTDVNYLVEIQNGDWVLGWLVNNRSDFESLVARIPLGKPCNEFNDGFKFVGRIHNVRKQVSVDSELGTKSSSYTVQCIGFSELDTQFFYDNSLASKDTLERDYGQWLTRIGIEVEALFGQNLETGIEKDNVNKIIPTLLNLIVGKGPSKSSVIAVDTALPGETIQADAGNLKEAPYSYVIPVMVAKLLGKDPSEASKPASVLGYSDILELLQGVQSYSNKSGPQVFVPDLSSESTSQRRVTPVPMMGTFLPFFPEFTNKPLWSVFQQYLNPTINEMYTALRVNPEGKVVPTIVLRQIPFTTNAFKETSQARFTRFLSLPRWEIPSAMIQEVDIGRSDATRINFVHVYGSSSYQTNAVAIQEQMVNNPPVKDDLDIIRSGLRPYMATVECWVDDTVGKVPSTWMNLIADWTMGSHLTLNGSLQTFGIQAPICEGDNLLFDGVVYHIESVSHSAAISADGRKQWRTSLTLTNGMRQDTDSNTDYPIYPGFSSDDNTQYDPGLSLEHRSTTGGDSTITTSDKVGGPGVLAPSKNTEGA